MLHSLSLGLKELFLKRETKLLDMMWFITPNFIQ